ncbi:hypothetical protein FBU59_003710, partial [Linderina macrospora]
MTDTNISKAGIRNAVATDPAKSSGNDYGSTNGDHARTWFAPPAPRPETFDGARWLEFKANLEAYLRFLRVKPDQWVKLAAKHMVDTDAIVLEALAEKHDNKWTDVASAMEALYPEPKRLQSARQSAESILAGPFNRDAPGAHLDRVALVLNRLNDLTMEQRLIKIIQHLEQLGSGEFHAEVDWAASFDTNLQVLKTKATRICETQRRLGMLNGRIKFGDGTDMPYDPNNKAGMRSFVKNRYPEYSFSQVNLLRSVDQAECEYVDEEEKDDVLEPEDVDVEDYDDREAEYLDVNDAEKRPGAALNQDRPKRRVVRDPKGFPLYLPDNSRRDSRIQPNKGSMESAVGNSASMDLDHKDRKAAVPKRVGKKMSATGMAEHHQQPVTTSNNGEDDVEITQRESDYGRTLEVHPTYEDVERSVQKRKLRPASYSAVSVRIWG